MKKFYLIVLAAFMLNTLSAQIWSDDFEGADLSAYTLTDADGDGLNWELRSNFVAHSGVQCAASASWTATTGAVTPNNYLTTPPIDLIDETGAIALSWWAYGQDQAWAAEHYEVVISNENTQSAIEAGDLVFEETLQAYGEYKQRTVDLSAYAGQVIYITFIHNEVTDFFYLNLDDISVYKPSSDDIGMTGLVSPDNKQNCMLGADEPITVSVFNYGGNPLTGFDISYAINGGTAVTATVTDVIPPASSYEFTFPDGADFSALGEYEMVVSANLDGDTNTANDEATYNFRSSDAVLTVHVMTDVSGGHNWTVTDLTNGQVVASHGAYAWNQEFSDDVCIYSDRCYSFEYSAGSEMGAGAYLELLLDGVTVAGDASGQGVPAEFSVGAVGGGCAANEAALMSINNKAYVEQNGNIVSGTVRNNGSAPINTLEMSYSLDGGTPVVEEFTGLNILSGGIFDYSFSQALDLPDVGEYVLEVSIGLVNGEVDAVTSNNSATKDLAVVSFVPDRGVVVEEATGTWCGFCPRGAEAMIYLEKYDNFNGIAVHNDDPMVVAEYDASFSSFISGYPSMSMDREAIDILPNDLAGFPDLDVFFERQSSSISPATIDVKATVPEAGSREVTISLTSEFVVPVSGDYRFNVILTEDGVTGTGADWAQVNYYSGGGLGPMNGYENLADPVPAADMVYDHVARALLGGFNGTAGSVPATVTRGEEVSYTFNYTVPAGYNMDNMHVIGMLVDGDNGYIVNSKSTSDFELSVGTEDVAKTNQVKVFPNPFSSQTNVRLQLEDSREVNMEVTNALGQRVAYREYGQISGDMILPFDGRNLENGIYFIRIQLDGELIVRKVMLSKN